MVLLGDAGTLSEGGLLTRPGCSPNGWRRTVPRARPLVVPVLNKCDIPGASAKQVIGISGATAPGWTAEGGVP